ncbi:hypothetical protein EIN_453950 [Entamoeba invadens IP1]|uniref:Uncharacterized protein n=1 Tax=Entamoeba invadens IP1 TaxID=370355 RepID=L7FLY2_ENTIV|nr:hypothetical protein EIN_453950 [Entamoeba invadens IP1]ELP89705.1 hypothetical protein EIN_453950 [Entamoeba invadens IP1]|eukprot:XP_004256476.1 hypothetical protein EIN_453950 [Entamoeba invadens IP1]
MSQSDVAIKFKDIVDSKEKLDELFATNIQKYNAIHDKIADDNNTIDNSLPLDKQYEEYNKLQEITSKTLENQNEFVDQCIELSNKLRDITAKMDSLILLVNKQKTDMSEHHQHVISQMVEIDKKLCEKEKEPLLKQIEEIEKRHIEKQACLKHTKEEEEKVAYLFTFPFSTLKNFDWKSYQNELTEQQIFAVAFASYVQNKNFDALKKSFN